MSFVAAFRFLTSVPFPWGRQPDPAQLGRATACFPAVGLIIGLVLAVLNWLLGLVLPPAVVSGLLIAALVLITGAIHLDGFVDTCDGLGGQKTAAERRRVMRDSRAGAFGIIGVVVLLLIKYASLESVPPEFMAATLIFMPVVGRWAMVYAIYVFPYAHPTGLGKAFKENTRLPQFIAATIITLAVALALFPFFSLTGLLVMAGVWVLTALLSLYLKSKFAGLTGDTYGAINEIGEVAALLIAAAVVNW